MVAAVLLLQHHPPPAAGAAAGAAAPGQNMRRSCEERTRSKRRPRQPSAQDNTGNSSNMGPSQETHGLSAHFQLGGPLCKAPRCQPPSTHQTSHTP
eukprot:1154478-Pelagomonas_calceolata.AAC.1